MELLQNTSSKDIKQKIVLKVIIYYTQTLTETKYYLFVI